MNRTVRDQRGAAGLRDAPRAPLLPPVPAGADPELVIHVGIDMQHDELCLRADIDILKVTRRTLPILQPVILWYEVIVHLEKYVLG